MCLMHTDLPGARRAEDHRDLVVGDAEVEAVEDRVAAERLLDVDELDGVGGAVVALEARVPLVGLLALARLLVDVAGDSSPVSHVRFVGVALGLSALDLAVSGQGLGCAVVGAALGRRPLVCTGSARWTSGSRWRSSARRWAARAAARRPWALLSGRPAAAAVPTAGRCARRQPRVTPPSCKSAADWRSRIAPQKICVPTMPMMWTITVLSTIDLAVAVPTPTGPPLAV